MSPFFRWLRFNLVGAIGVPVQLSALALFHRYAPDRSLWTTAAAVEVTLLHNYVWHRHFTWRDRCSDSAPAAQLLRFHLSNGSVSMLGNLTLMRILTVEARLPLLAANAIAIICCSLINFLLGESWAFPQKSST
jgi:putative flippase GtrA